MINYQLVKFCFILSGESNQKRYFYLYAYIAERQQIDQQLMVDEAKFRMMHPSFEPLTISQQLRSDQNQKEMININHIICKMYVFSLILNHLLVILFVLLSVVSFHAATYLSVCTIMTVLFASALMFLATN